MILYDPDEPVWSYVNLIHDVMRVMTHQHNDPWHQWSILAYATYLIHQGNDL